MLCAFSVSAQRDAGLLEAAGLSFGRLQADQLQQ